MILELKFTFSIPKNESNEKSCHEQDLINIYVKNEYKNCFQN